MLARSFLDLSAYHTGCLTMFSHFAKHWRGVYVEVTPSDLGYVGPFGVEVVASFGTGATRVFFLRETSVYFSVLPFCQTFVQRIRLCQLEDASFKQLVIPAGRDCIFCATENQVRSIGCLSCTYIFLRRKTKQQTLQTWWVNWIYPFIVQKYNTYIHSTNIQTLKFSYNLYSISTNKIHSYLRTTCFYIILHIEVLFPFSAVSFFLFSLPCCIFFLFLILLCSLLVLCLLRILFRYLFCLRVR